MNNSTRSIIQWFAYSFMFYIVFMTGELLHIKITPIVFTLGFFAGILNEILEQLKRIK